MLTEFSSIIELTQKFSTEQACIDHLEAIRWGGNVVSPFDPASKVYKCRGNRYKCVNTNKYFNVRTGTIFEDTKLALQKWFVALYIFSSHKKGISSHQLAKDLDITQKSAWFVLQRLRYAFDHPNFKAAMANVVEVDETYWGGREKNKHNNKKSRGTDGKYVDNKAAIVGMVQRDGILKAQLVDKVERDFVEFWVTKNVVPGSTVMTDEARPYRILRDSYTHKFINHSAKQWVDGVCHTNTIEGFWSLFKRGVHGIYHQISFKHLQRYTHEFVLRYNTRKLNECSRFNFILENMVGRLTYKDLIA